ncbi:hypothetical protein H4V97_000009 [Flavobacterium sp. CG_23.5]|uniref:hypothetical protein n=1 Tax=Flavobacterium sp. CG_23.5 TaxID=2760708 RepID=UPI001AE8B7B8|nr:hypothetical protein [Flavobacterium sp. CG_23.5]MBP2281691.1 hypothetical protein [Flavobacterium sp. CG_23.5]
MASIKIGAIFSLKNHPYTIGNTDVKISALAQMTPPLLVVTEILNNVKEFDTETGDRKNKQIKCIFYSHKTHKFENYWFNPEQLTPITEKNINSTLSTDHDNLAEIETRDEDVLTSIGIEYKKTTSLVDLKKEFLNRQVILKSCDFELGKQKSTFEKNGYKTSQKINAHLDFVPPVLTVIDVKQNDEKITHNPKTGNQKKVSSFFLLKCKWYNPSLGGFSEDFLPIEAVDLIPEIQSISAMSNLIASNKLLRFSLENPIELESGIVLNHTYLQLIDLEFNHYKYKLKCFDFFTSIYTFIDLSEVDVDENKISLEDIISEKIPEYNKIKQNFSSVKEYVFTANEYYKITYSDALGKVTKRVILVKEFIKDKIVIADCLLRNGEERHFKIDKSILKIEALKSEFFK